MSRQPVKVCLVGAGRVGSIHLANFLELPHLFRLTSVVDDFPSSTALDILSGHSTIPLRPQREFNESVAEADAVAIATPTNLHEEQIMQCFKANKHVFSEKPIVQTVDAVHSVYDLAAEKGLVLLCGMTRRFETPAVKIKEELEAGNIGRILKLTFTSHDNPCPPIEFLRNSNIYNDFAIHDVDMALWLTSEKPNLVYCVGHGFNPQIAEIGDDDSGSVLLKFPSGVIATVDISRVSKFGFDASFVVQGEEKSLYSQSVSYDGYLEASSKGLTMSCLPYSFSEKYERGFKAELNHFSDCLTGKMEPIVKKEEVLAVTLVLDAINNSRKTGQPVTIDYETFTFNRKV